MKDEVRKHLLDILDIAEELQGFTEGMDFKGYQKSQVTQRAVERNFEIIGEALARIKKLDEEVLARISDHHRIIGFRNILIHGYDIVDEMVVWNAVKNHLPILLREIQEILRV
jgi:uncharacterized protein with HEPN domain